METISSKESSPEERIARMNDFIIIHHAEQMRGEEPYVFHCKNVANIINDAFTETGELEQDIDLLTNIRLSALGHDLIEDTKITKENIEAEFGEEVAILVDYLTNYEGDNNRTKYVNNMGTAPEEAKLVKIADMTENCLSVAYNAQSLGLEWIQSFFLPIINEMKSNIKIEQFTKYRKTAVLLFKQLEFAYRRLYNSISNIKPSNMTEIPAPEEDEITKKLLEKTGKIHDEFLAEESEAIAKAKQENPDKEPLDLDELQKYYSLASGLLHDEPIINDATIREIEVTYWIKHPEIKTMEELAEVLKRQDAYDVG